MSMLTLLSAEPGRAAGVGCMLCAASGVCAACSSNSFVERCTQGCSNSW